MLNTDPHDRRFDRLWVAAVTPYGDGGFDVDEKALRRLLEYFLQPSHVEAGLAVVINPEAGELFCLTREEKRRSVEIAVEVSAGRAPVFAGVIDLRTEDVVAAAVDAKAAGVDGIFVMPPVGAIDITTSWNAERYPEVWIDAVRAVDDAVDLPLIAHPVAAPTIGYGVGLPVGATIQMCEEITNFVGWKMTYNWAGHKTVAHALRQLDRHVGVLGAVASNFHEALACDLFDGTVTGSFNYALEPMIEHIEHWRAGDWRAASELWNAGLWRLHDFMYQDFSRLHVRYKLATWLRDLIPHPLMRPPMPKPTVAEARTARQLLLSAQLDVIDDEPFEQLVATLPR